MILVDANILLYAEDRQSPCHEAARNWWDKQLSGSSPVGLCWEVICSFIRIGTNPRVFENPLSLSQAVSRVRSWLEQPCVRIIKPTDRHWEAFTEMLSGGQAAANFVMDAHLAALAMEHGCVLVTTDRDFSRFPKLKWNNPLA